MDQFRAYLITNIINGMRYVGIVGRNGKTIRARWREHCNAAFAVRWTPSAGQEPG
jgi:hypothetical protein